MLRKLLLFIVLVTVGYVNAQTLYWVGGSGNFNDGNHWSLVSGGNPANVNPSNKSNLIFDDKSSLNNLVINITGLNYVNSIKFLNTSNDFHITGSSLSSLHCRGDFILNNRTYFEANTSLIFSSSTTQYNDVNFSGKYLKTNVLFEDGNWNLQSIKLDDNYLLKINKGNYKVNNASVIVWDLESASAHVNFEINDATFYVKNRLVLGEKVAFNSNELILIAQKDNPNLYQIDSKVNFGSSYKIFADKISSPQACSITYSFTNPSCAGSCDASITVGFDAGCTTGPYDLVFNNSSGCFPSGVNGVMPPTFTLNSICSCSGQLDIFVFDAVGFVTQLSGLPTPQAPTNVSLLFSGQVQPRCFGDCDGSVNAFISGGSPPYNLNVLSSPSGSVVSTFTNIPAISTTTVTGLCAGTYSFVVTDANLCTRTFTTIMTQPTQVNPNAVVQNITCNSVCNGSVTTTASGGVGPYTYSWISASSSPSTATSASYTNLCPGVVTLTVTDSKTCTATYSTNITQPPAITLTVTRTNLICGSLCDGTASVTATGGSGVFPTYSWTPNVSSGPSATALCAGPYTVTVTDDLNCSRSITFTLTAPLTLTATATQTNLACNSACIGVIRLSTSGGTAPYTYAWSPPAVSTTSVASNLCEGPYTFTITDNVNCTYTNTVTITQPPAVTLTVNKTDVSCFGACNGTAIANTSGGTGSFTYTWSPLSPVPVGQGTGTITSLCPGTYTVRVADANLCSRTATVAITEPTVISANVTTVSPTCNGVCDGSINSSPSGGAGAPYTFTLQPAVGGAIIGSPPFTGLCADNYTLTIRDALGCIRTQTINFTQPNPITLALSATALNCFNQCNSTISALIAGGTPTYAVNWSGGGSGLSITGQCAGIHTATVTDFNGCRATASINIASPPDMTVTISAVTPNCDGQCNGVATATVVGGTPNYTVNWSNGTVGTINSNLCVGNYTATVTDSRGCIKTQTIAIITPPALTLTTTNGTVTCAGSCDGSVSVTATGGTSGYFYSWNSTPTQTNAVAVNLCAGNYIVSVTDTKGCLASATASVTQPAALTASISNVQPSCNVCIGSATANGVGGTGTYTFSWSPGNQTGPTPTNLCVGTQTVRITDSRGCTITQTVQINQTVNIAITANGNILTCNGVCTGVATATASGGTGPYSYSWTPQVPNQTTATASALCAGSHTVLVIDINGCSNTNTVTFTNPPAISLTINQTNVTCNSLCNGSASATATGGTGTMTYSWSNGATTAFVTGLCAGDYTVTATDANNCNQTQTVTIIQSNSLTATFTSVNPSGCNLSDGSISFVPGGGIIPYSFTWTPGPSVNPKTNLPQGIYILDLADANGCAQSFTTTLSDPLSPTVTVTSNSLICFGSCIGSASLSITSASPTFSISWSSPIPSTNTSTLATALCPGIFVATVTDANSCTANQTFTITQPTQVSTTGTVTNISCNAVCDGAINITTIGGEGSYSYTWTPAGGNVEDPVNLCANTYSVVIEDGNNCVVTNTYVLIQPPALTLSFNKRDILCNGGCTGTVRAIVGGGALPYSFTWPATGSFPGSNLDTIINLCSGIYTVNVTDANGCTISGTVSIGEPPVLTSTIISTNVKCNGQCNGSAIINPTGGTLPYSFSYNTSPPITTPTITGLCIGTYTGIVTDANGCSSSNGFIITEPLPIVITTTVSNPKCNAVCNGSVATTVTGGNSTTYQYSWSPAGGTVSNPTGLCDGNYTVTVTDDSLCTNQAVVALIDPVALIANISFTNPTCNTGCNGIVTANPTGGTTPYSFAWTDPLNTNQTVTNLCAGDYTLIVSDFNSCQDTQMVTLIAPPAISVNPGISPPNCGVSNGSINAPAAGGLSPYTYNWLNPVIIGLGQQTNTVVTGIPAGIYTVVVTDAAACSATIVIPLSNADGPTGATITSTNVTCNGLCNGASAISDPVGGTPSYTLSWINPVSSNTLITGLCAGTYTAQIIDANGCLFFQADTIVEPQLIDDNESITSANCFGNCNGVIALTPTGGNGGYTYSWTPSASTGTVINLCPGAYSATVTDVLGCTFIANYNLPSLISISGNTISTNNICFNNCDGSLSVTNVAGGLPPYSFNWSDPLGQSSPSANNLCNGNYSVTIMDANGCFDQLPAEVTSPSQVTFTPAVTQPGCGLCDGSALITPTGGTPSYTLIWSNNQTGTSLTSLCAGVYMVQITDGNGCVSDTNIIINSSSTITGEIITKADVSCSGVCDGSVTVTAVGGVNPITYNWLHNNSASQSLTGLCGGTYYCNMTDSAGCIRTASVVIGSITTLTISSQVTQSSCSSSTGSITVNVTGGTSGPYTYSWLPLSTGSTATVTNLAPGSYTLTVSDGNCSQTQIFSINSVNAPILDFTKKDISCGTVCDGSIALSPSGGSPGYTILWSNGLSTPTITNLCSGAYSVTVTDVAGCTAVQNFSLNVVSPIVFSAPDLNNVLCNGNCNGSITSIPSGGSLPYTFTWTPVLPSAPTASSLCPGNYSIAVSDVNGCLASQSYTISSPPALTLTAIVTTPSCSTLPDGSIDITVAGGTPSYSYSWTPNGVATEDLVNVLAGSYTVSIVDGNGCTKDSSFVINALITVNAIAGNDTVFCENGTLLLDGSNSSGAAGTTYQWISLPTNSVIASSLVTSATPATGTSTYVLMVTDAGGTCIDMDSVVVTSNPLPVVDAGPMVSMPVTSSSTIGGNPTTAIGNTINWTPVFGLDNPTGANPISSTTVTTIYTVTVVDVNGCSNSDTVTVYVYPEVMIPNGFSPNADGKNDVWQIDFIDQFPDCEVEVYNRWGEQLFYSKGYTVPFNGQYKGKDLPVGTYYYIINLNHPSYPDAYTSPLTIFR